MIKVALQSLILFPQFADDMILIATILQLDFETFNFLLEADNFFGILFVFADGIDVIHS